MKSGAGCKGCHEDVVAGQPGWRAQFQRELAGLPVQAQAQRLVPPRPLMVSYGEPVQLAPDSSGGSSSDQLDLEGLAKLKNPLFQGEPILLEVRQGKTTICSGEGTHIQKVQQALISLGIALPRYGADGKMGDETQAALKTFQTSAGLPTTGVIDQDTMAALDKLAPSSLPQSYVLSNPLFAGDAELQEVANGLKTILSGSGEHIQKVQTALLNLGFNLPLYSADGDFGSETQMALEQFQNVHQLDPTRVIDTPTLRKLDELAPAEAVQKTLKYEELLKDGLLDITVGVGYEEKGRFDEEIVDIKTALVSQLDMKEIDAALAKEVYQKAGMTMPEKGAGVYFLTQIPYKDNQVNVLVRLITYEDPEAKQAFLEAMQKSDVAFYSGHGRGGSGMDFDDIKEGAGNIWVNPKQTVKHPKVASLYKQIEKSGAEKNALADISFDKKYKIWFFDGCFTAHYFQPIRVNKTVDPKNVDMFGWPSTSYAEYAEDNLVAFIEGLINQKSPAEIIEQINELNNIKNPKKGVTVEGLGDNPNA